MTSFAFSNDGKTVYCAQSDNLLSNKELELPQSLLKERDRTDCHCTVVITFESVSVSLDEKLIASIVVANVTCSFPNGAFTSTSNYYLRVWSTDSRKPIITSFKDRCAEEQYKKTVWFSADSASVMILSRTELFEIDLKENVLFSLFFKFASKSLGSLPFLSSVDVKNSVLAVFDQWRCVVFDYKRRNCLCDICDVHVDSGEIFLQMKLCVLRHCLLFVFKNIHNVNVRVTEQNYETKTTFEWNTESVRQATFSSDGSLLACLGESAITIVHVENRLSIKHVDVKKDAYIRELLFSPKNLNLGFTYDARQSNERKVGVVPLLDVEWISTNATLLLQLEFPPYVVLEIIDWLLAFNKSGVNWYHRVKVDIIYKAKRILENVYLQKANNNNKCVKCE